MASVETVKGADRARGAAAILAIGTANPPNCILQADYPDYFFRVTNREHMTELKEKFRRICEKSMVRKRHFLLTEEIIKKYPSVCSYGAPSLDARQDITVPEVPELGKEAALKAIENWGQPKSKITHLIFSANPGIDMPGGDIQLTRLLGLELSVKRMMFYHPACSMGAHLLGIAKDIAENNAAARVLVVSCDITVGTFRGPGGPSDQEADIPSLILQATTGDGAAALIIGADPSKAERPLFQIVSAKQTMIPDSHHAIRGEVRERGLTAGLSKDVPLLISQNIGKCLAEAFNPLGLGISNWNSIFWAVQPGGAAILKLLEANVGLNPEKLAATWHVLGEYGNMGSGTVYFILDEMSRRSINGRKATTTGEGMEWGVVVGVGAGITITTVVLRSFPAHG